MVAILYFSIAVLITGTTLFGWNLAELNAPQKAIQYELGLDAAQFGFAASILAVGGLVGSISSPACMKALGRKRFLLLNAVGFALAGIAKGTASNLVFFAGGRFVSGVCSGVATVIVPVYLNELAPPGQKGSFGALTQISIGLGILAAQVLGIFMDKDGRWRYILITGGLIGGLQAILLYFLPESPMSLVAVGKFQQAREVLVRLRGTSDVEEELAMYIGAPAVSPEDGISREEEANPLLGREPEEVGLWEYISKAEYRRGLIAVTGIMLAQQLLGINAVVFYGVAILQDFFSNSATSLNAGISLVNLFITIAATSMFDRVSHKELLIGSMQSMTTFSFLLCLGISYNLPILSVLATLFFVASFSFGLGPLPWMVASRKVEAKAVGAAQSIALTANWLGTFAVSFVVPILSGAAGMAAVFLMFGFLGLIFTCWGGFYL